MNLFFFFLTLAICGYIFTWVFPLLMSPVLGLFMLASRRGADENAVQRPSTWFLMAFAFAVNSYVVWGWAAYVAFYIRNWSSSPQVTQHWAYYLLGFFGCIAPLTYMASKDTGKTGSSIHIFLTAVAFITFCIWPTAAHALYGWLPALFGK